MKQKKRASSIALIAWFLFVIIFLSAWNADRFVKLMEEELQGITPKNAKVRTDSWNTFYTEYFRFMEPLAELSGISFMVLNKKSVDNYKYVKEKTGNMQLLEDYFDHSRVEESLLTLANAFGRRDIPFIFVSMPPRFDYEAFPIAQDVVVFGRRDEQMLSFLHGAGVEVLDTEIELKNAGLRYLYPFKTDLHLETEGEFETARLLAERLFFLGVEVKDRDIIFDKGNYTVEAHDFSGNLAQSSGNIYTSGKDSFELWYPDFDTDLKVEDPVAKNIREGQFARSVMNGMDDPMYLSENPNPYWVVNYLQFSSAFYTIENKKLEDGCKLLLVIDSYAMRTVAYLSLGTGQITVIDPRIAGAAYYLADAMENGDYDAVIVAAGGRDFYASLAAGL